jgi:hypothetical protein
VGDWTPAEPSARRIPAWCEGLKPRERSVHRPIHAIDPHEPASVRLRNQAIRQSIVAAEAARLERQASEQAFDDEVRRVNAALTPYLRSLDALEAPRTLTREQVARHSEGDRLRRAELRAMLEGVQVIPDLVWHTAVLLDCVSAENRAAKERQRARGQAAAAARAKRAELNEALYREWAS